MRVVKKRTEHLRKLLKTGVRKPLYSLPQKYKRHKVHFSRATSVLIAAVLFGSFLAPILLTHRVQAYDTQTHTDWSGGQNTDSSVNVVTSNAGHITLGNGGPPSWCATTNCDISFTKRKQINISSNQTRSDYQVLIEVPYDSDMKNGFEDLRFATMDGATDLSYFVRYTDPGVLARVFVKIPALNSGSSSIYMYYGNSSASSLSNAADTLYWADNFANNDTSNMYFTDMQGFSISGGVLHQDGSAADGASFGPNSLTYTRADPVTSELGITVLDNNCTADYTCGELFPNVSAGTYPTPWNTYGFTLGPQTGDMSANGGTPRPSTVSVTATSDINETGTDTYGNTPVPNMQVVPTGSSTKRAYRMAATSDYLGAAYAYSEANDGVFAPLAVSNSTTATQDNFGLNFYIIRSPVFDVDHIYQYKIGATITTQFEPEEVASGQTGTLTSPIIDFGAGAFFYDTLFSYDGTGTAKVRIRTSSFADMHDAPSIELCNGLDSGAAINTSSCYRPGRYVQYQIFLTDSGTVDLDFTSITIQYINDLVQPTNNASAVTLKRSATGQQLSSGSWVGRQPYISWTAATDNSGGAGIAGYCVYLGTDDQGDPSTDYGGIINTSENNPVTTPCPYATSGTQLDLTSTAGLITGTQYYVNILAIDSAGNISTAPVATTSFRYENSPPALQSVFAGPNGVVNTLEYTVTWPGNLILPTDSGGSGFAGLKYCVSNVAIGISGCEQSDNNWYGSSHTSGQLTDTSDIIPFSDSAFTLKPADASRLMMNGVNFITVWGIDNAGNATNFSDNNPIITITSNQAPTSPTSLAVNPTSSSTNAFSFTWAAPATYVGAASAINYCWTVNEPVASDGANCHWTGAGITQLASGPYATKQGVNTLYLMAKDSAGNYNASSAAQIDFTASTAAPGVPTDLVLSDISIRKPPASWKLALSWNAPVSSPVSIDSYKVYRSTNGTTYTEVGSTSSSNLSFIDSGLSQIPYYYQVKACDNAGSCGVAVTPPTGLTPDQFPMTPTGRYTEPARLTSDTDQPKIKDVGTRKSTIYWFTDRESDSKIAYGTSSGNYFPSEVSNSSQTSNHSVSLSNLQPSTTYYYVAKWTDQDGNTGTSVERTFTTLPAPALSEVTATNVSISAADITFKVKSAAKVKIYYGKSSGFGGLKSVNTSTTLSEYSVRLPDLDDGTKYFYRLDGVDEDSNEYAGDTYSFTTPARPKISNVRFQPVEGSPSSTQKVSWTTNVPTTSELSYGPKGGKTTESITSALVVSHEVTIQGLDDDTEYVLTATSRDDKGNVAKSDPQNFKTALDTRPPKISDINIETSIRGTGSEARGQIVVSWRTDEKSTSQVSFGQGQSGAFTNRTAEDGKLTTEHVVIVSDLPTSSIYHIKAVSHDKANNASESEGLSAIINRGSENVFSIIFNALQKIFGLGA